MRGTELRLSLIHEGLRHRHLRLRGFDLTAGRGHAALPLFGVGALVRNRKIVLCLRLAQLGELVFVVEHDEELSTPYRLIRIDQDLIDALWNFAGNGGLVGGDVRVIRALVGEHETQPRQAPDQREHDDDRGSDQEEIAPARARARLFRIGTLGLFGRGPARTVSLPLDDGLLLICLARVHYEFLTPLRKTST